METVNSDLGFDYESQYEEIRRLEEDFETFKLATQEIIYAIDDMDSEFNDALSGCVERLSLIDINRYKVDNTAGIEYIEERWEQVGFHPQEELVKCKVKPRKLTFNDLMRTSLTRAMKKREYDTFMKAMLGNTIDSEDRYIQYINQLYKSAEFDHTTKSESIENSLTTVLGVVAIGAGLTVISGGLFGFAVPGYVATAGQVAGGILTAKDIGHLITGKDINGNPLSETDKEALMGSFILDATMVGVSSFSKLKLKYANKVNRMDGIEEVSKAEKVILKDPLPNIENAIIDPRKLSGYALNPEHPVGGNKAKVFESTLGYNKSNADDLMKQVYSKLSESESVIGKLDQYGQRYTVDMNITGPNGNSKVVRTGWIIKPESIVPELTTIYVK